VIRRVAALSGFLAITLAGCGLNVQSPDLFLLTRTGQGKPLTLLVSDDGSIRCNNGASKQLPDSLLIEARTLASDLDNEAKAKLHIPPGRGSVAFYAIRLQDGSISFPDNAAARHRELAEVELFTVRAAQQGCGLSG
jgi:hypothetical protein